MKSIILYESKSGCTEKCANYIYEKHGSEISKITKLKETITDYDTVVLMGPVYMGKINSDVMAFLNKHKEELFEKKLYIILCGMNEEGFDAMVRQNLSDDIRKHAEIVHAGGAYYLEKLGFFQKRIIKAVAKVTQSSEHIKYDNLDKIKI